MKDESNDCVRDLFWAHPTSIQLLNAFCSVLIMDCTYKTNRYRLPLLEIVGVTSTNLTFFCGICILGGRACRQLHLDNGEVTKFNVC